MTEATDPPSASTPPRRSRARRLIARLALLCVTLVLLAGTLEVATRLLTNIVPPLLVQDPVVGKRYLRSFSRSVYEPEAARHVVMRFNRDGFRGPDRPYEKPADVHRVAVLGDSMIAGLAVDEEQTLVGRLEQLLREDAAETTWEVLNFGVSGSSPGQAMVLYREIVTRYDPDVVLCAFFVGNDLSDNCNRLSSNPRIYFDLDASGRLIQQPFSAKRAGLSVALNRYSRFYVWQKYAMARARTKARQVVQQINPGQWVYCRDEPEDVAYAWRLSGAIAGEFRRVVEADGRRFAVVMIPSPEQIYDNYYAAVVARAGDDGASFDQDYPDERMRALCRDAGVAFLSMTEDFRRAAPARSTAERDEWLYLNGTGHFNEHGHEVAARAVYRFLEEGDPAVAVKPFTTDLR